jgi:hypothetical protein
MLIERSHLVTMTLKDGRDVLATFAHELEDKPEDELRSKEVCSNLRRLPSRGACYLDSLKVALR